MKKNKDHGVKILRIIGQCKAGGTETIALNYYENLNHNLVHMDFLFFGNSLPRYNAVLETYGDKVINVTDYTENIFRSIKDIADIVQKGNYDIIHAQLNALNAIPLLGAFLGGAKIRIAANHSTANLKYETGKSVIKYIVRPTVKIFATNYAACSNYAGAWCFGKRALLKGKVYIIRNAIDLEKFHYDERIRNSVREEMGWMNSFVIGHAGRFTEQKNHKFMIEIFSIIHKKCPAAILVFAGEGHLMEEIKQRVHLLGLDEYVYFLGIRFDMNRIMQGMDIFLFPSLYEGLGNVITESQAVGLRSVVSDAVPNEVKITELVDFLSLSDSADKWADKILNYQDGYERRDTSKDIRTAGYEIRSAVEKLQDYYFSLAQEKTGDY